LTQQLVVQISCCALHEDDKGDEQTKTNPCILKRMDGHSLPHHHHRTNPYSTILSHTQQRYKGVGGGGWI